MVEREKLEAVAKQVMEEEGIEVVGVAQDGVDALEQVERLHPDVITLDLVMPRMDGVTFLKELMKCYPTPVVVVSIASEAGELAMAALEAGALDFVQKPTSLATEEIFAIQNELLAKVKAAAVADITRLPTPLSVPVPTPRLTVRKGLIDIVVIGVSTGGPQALRAIVPAIPHDFPIPLVTVLHMPVGYTGLFARRLDELAAIEVREAREGDIVRPGRMLLAPAGHHLTFRRMPDEIIVHLTDDPTDTLHRPSVDVMFVSAAEVYGHRVLGVVLTGMGKDGLEGARRIKETGGYVFAEAPSTCVVYGMPRAVVEAELVDRLLPLDVIPQALFEFV
ncbi:MAG TPA: chemotaxis-specific protein-glutamate methyltransferase CheB [Anaerolineae bacterium]|nr:chemotaxis-specific protein-glutamate methyltransferase CheB [Anaerolineae bacterium]